MWSASELSDFGVQTSGLLHASLILVLNFNGLTFAAGFRQTVDVDLEMKFLDEDDSDGTEAAIRKGSDTVKSNLTKVRKQLMGASAHTSINTGKSSFAATNFTSTVPKFSGTVLAGMDVLVSQCGIPQCNGRYKMVGEVASSGYPRFENEYGYCLFRREVPSIHTSMALWLQVRNGIQAAACFDVIGRL